MFFVVKMLLLFKIFVNFVNFVVKRSFALNLRALRGKMLFALNLRGKKNMPTTETQ